MTPFLIVLIAALAVFWFYRRGRKLRKTPESGAPGPHADVPEPGNAAGFELGGDARDPVSDSTSGQAKQEAAGVAALESRTEPSELEIASTPTDKVPVVEGTRPSDDRTLAAVADEVGAELQAEPSIEEIEPYVERPVQLGTTARLPDPYVLPAADESPVAEETQLIEDLIPAGVEDEARAELEAERSIENTEPYVEWPVPPAAPPCPPSPRVLPAAANEPPVAKEVQRIEDLTPADVEDELGAELEAERLIENTKPHVERPVQPAAPPCPPSPRVLPAAANESPVAKEVQRIGDLTPADVEDELGTELEAERLIENTEPQVERPVQPAAAARPPDPPVLPTAVVEPATRILECERAVKPNEAHSESSPAPAVEAESEGEESEVEMQVPGFPENSNGRPAQRYRPPVQKPRRALKGEVKEEISPPRPTQTEAALGVFVHLTFDRSSFCTIGLLPVRLPESDQDVEVRSGKDTWRLLAQEDWYQDIEPENMGERLRAGIELRGALGNQRQVRWQLKGRDIYVLAAHPRAAGYVSAPRLLLGRADVVLCIEEIARETEDVLAAAGCKGYTRIEESLGVPRGWVGFRGVLPTNALALDPGIDRFYALKPAPDIDIVLEGGVCIRNSAWLAGYPPNIKLYGQQNGIGRVLIDGHEATRAADGSLIADGYDQTGEHSVYCEGLSRSRTYSIEVPPDSWDEWTAYRFGAAGICGPLVQLNTEAAVLRPITIPMSNPLLVGAEPGEIFHCSVRNVGRWKGIVPFKVVWALPAQPLTSNKKTARVIQFSDTPIMRPPRLSKRAANWCNAILDASRKGLLIESEFADSASRWREYRDVARRLRRAAR